MGTQYRDAIVSSLGPLRSLMPRTGTPPLTTAGVLTTNVGTTPVQIIDAGGKGGTRKVVIRNLHATQLLAYAFVENGGTAPLAANFTATAAGAATDGVLIPAGQTGSFDIPDVFDVYIVGSGAATTYQVAMVGA